jgi:hypothetical protein
MGNMIYNKRLQKDLGVGDGIGDVDKKGNEAEMRIFPEHMYTVGS